MHVLVKQSSYQTVFEFAWCVCVCVSKSTHFYLELFYLAQLSLRNVCRHFRHVPPSTSHASFNLKLCLALWGGNRAFLDDEPKTLKECLAWPFLPSSLIGPCALFSSLIGPPPQHSPPPTPFNFLLTNCIGGPGNRARGPSLGPSRTGQQEEAAWKTWPSLGPHTSQRGH